MILPCYNEEKTIAQVIDEVFAVLPNAHIYVFDNNSSDNSRNIVKAKIDEIKSLDCHIERSEISKMESKKDFSCLHTRTSGALAHTCKNDKIGESSNFTQKAPHSPIKAENLDSTPTNHANKNTNSSNCSVALEALSELEGRSYLSDNDYPSNSLNRSNCIDKGEFLQNLDSKTHKSLKQLTLFFCIGGGITLLELLGFYILYKIFGVHYILASLIMFVLASGIGVAISAVCVWWDAFA